MQKLYWGGDLAEYTGNVSNVHGAPLYEIIILEGRKKGELKYTYRNPDVEAEKFKKA